MASHTVALPTLQIEQRKNKKISVKESFCKYFIEPFNVWLLMDYCLRLFRPWGVSLLNLDLQTRLNTHSVPRCWKIIVWGCRGQGARLRSILLMPACKWGRRKNQLINNLEVLWTNHFTIQSECISKDSECTCHFLSMDLCNLDVEVYLKVTNIGPLHVCLWFWTIVEKSRGPLWT